jgi:hypothetical protein
MIARVNYRSWLLRILTWDTVLPVAVVFIPNGIALLFPNRRGILEVTSVVLPVGAFLLRLVAGKRQIALNRCSEIVRKFQFCIFFLGILPLVLIDCVVILSHLMPDGALFATNTDRLVWTVLIAIYLVSMAVAMYPGSARAETNQYEGDDYARGHEAGRRWAAVEAAADDLIRLKNWKEDAGNQWEDGFSVHDQAAYGPQEDFVFTISPEHDGDLQVLGEFWEHHSGEPFPTGDFVYGFAEGALDIWDEVSDQP